MPSDFTILLNSCLCKEIIWNSKNSGLIFLLGNILGITSSGDYNVPLEFGNMDRFKAVALKVWSQDH